MNSQIKAISAHKSRRVSTLQNAKVPAHEQIQANPKNLADRMILWMPDLEAVTGKCERTIHRWISAGQFPTPDRHLNGRPLWKRSTIEAWAGTP